MNARTRSILVCALGLCLGFDWPGQATRLAADLETANARDRREIIRLLAAMNSEEAEPVILAACQDSDASVRREALRAAGRIGASKATTVLLRALSDPDATIRTTAAEALGTLKATDAEQPLSRALADSEATVRRAAVAALAKLPPGGQLAALIAALDDIDVDVRIEAVRALAAMPSERARDALLGKTRDSAPDVRAAALDASAKTGDPRAQVALSQALEDNSDNVVLAAIRGLRALGNPEQTELLVPLLRSPRSRIVAAARLAIEHAAGAREQKQSASTSGVAAWITWLERTVEPAADATAIIAGLEATLPEGEALALDPLVLYLPRVPHEQLARFAQLLGRTRAPGAAAQLVNMIDDSDPRVRAAAVEALGRVAGAGQTPALLARLDDLDGHVRAAAGHALGALADAPTFALLLERAEGEARNASGDESERRADTLIAIADATRRLRAGLPNRDRERLHAVLVDALTAAEPMPAVEAARGLGELGDAAAVSSLRDLDRHARIGVRVAAARALSRSENAPATAALRSLAGDDSLPVRATAIAALGLTGDESDVPTLQEALSHGRWPLGPVATFALASLVTRGQAKSDALCALVEAPEPLTRENARAGLRAQPSAQCAQADLTSEGGVDGPLPAPNTWHALLLEDGRILISHPDALGDLSFPKVVSVGTESPWRRPYGVP